MKTIFFYLYLTLLFGIFSCSDSVYNLEQKNKEIVAKAFDIVEIGNYDEMGTYIAEDYKRHCQATPELSIESLDAFKEFIRMDRLSIPDQKLNVKMLVAEGDLVAFWATYTGTQTGQMGPFPPSNKFAELDFSGVHRIENGKIVETWITWDNISILSQFGHFPPATEPIQSE